MPSRILSEGTHLVLVRSLKRSPAATVRGKRTTSLCWSWRSSYPTLKPSPVGSLSGSSHSTDLISSACASNATESMATCAVMSNTFVASTQSSRKFR